jgi:hypothetical protein
MDAWPWGAGSHQLLHTDHPDGGKPNWFCCYDLEVADEAAAPRSYVFLKNNFPGTWRTARFISRLSNATETADAGRPH